MGLEVTVLEDGRLKVVSDDKGAENVRVGDALEDNDLCEAADQWNDTPLSDDGKLEVVFGADQAKDVVFALEAEFGPDTDEAYEQLKQMGSLA